MAHPDPRGNPEPPGSEHVEALVHEDQRDLPERHRQLDDDEVLHKERVVAMRQQAVVVEAEDGHRRDDHGVSDPSDRRERRPTEPLPAQRAAGLRIVGGGRGAGHVVDEIEFVQSRQEVRHVDGLPVRLCVPLGGVTERGSAGEPLQECRAV